MNRLTKKGILALVLSLTLAVLAPAGSLLAALAESSDREFYEFTLMQNFSSLEQSENVTEYFKRVEEKLNTRVNFRVAPSSNYDESVQIMLASGDFPDAILIPDINKQYYLDAVQNDLIIPITPYLEAYGQNILKYSYDISLDALKTKGTDDIYGIPRTTIVRADGIAVRKDWADNLGITLPEEGGSLTLDAFTELMRAFTYDDPDGNGVNDTFGLRVDAVDGVMKVPLQVGWAFELYGWQEVDGKYVDLQYSREHDNYKRALAYMNMLWTEGYVDPDWPSISADVSGQRMDAGMYGIAPSFAGYVAGLEGRIKAVNPEGEIRWLAGIQNEDGEVKGSSLSTGLFGFTSIMYTAEHPERIVELYDYMLSDEMWNETIYGPEGLIWAYDSNGDKVKIAEPTIKVGNGWQSEMVRRNNSPDFFVSLDVAPELRPNVLKNIDISINNSIFDLSAGFTSPMSSDLGWLDYQSQIAIATTKIIVGDLPVDAWDETLDGYYAAGYDRYSEYVLEYINSRN